MVVLSRRKQLRSLAQRCLPLASPLTICTALPAPHCVPQRQILDKLREAEKGVDKEVEEVIAERRRCRELMVSEWRVSGCTPAAAPARVLRCRCSAWPCCSAYAVLCCAVLCTVLCVLPP